MLTPTGRCAWLWRENSGIAAVEFAIILPLMILVYVGVVDLTRSAIESRKVQRVSNTISDLVSQQPTQKQLTPAAIASILSASTAIMSPYPTSNLSMTVSAIDLKPKLDGTCCDATVRWSYTQGGTLRPCVIPLQQVASGVPPAPGNIPAAMVQSTVLGTYATGAIVVADVRDTYQPIFRQAIAFLAGGMNRTTYVLPRGVGQLNVPVPFTAQAGQQAVACL